MAAYGENLMATDTNGDELVWASDACGVPLSVVQRIVVRAVRTARSRRIRQAPQRAAKLPSATHSVGTDPYPKSGGRP